MQAIDHASGTVFVRPQRECDVRERWQETICAVRKAQDIDPCLERLTVQTLHLGVLQGLAVEAKPAVHLITT